MPTKPSIEQCHAAILRTNGALAAAARDLGCTADWMRAQKKAGKKRGFKYPPLPLTPFTKAQPPDPTPKELRTMRDAINAGWSDEERSRRLVCKVRPLEIPCGLHPCPEEGGRAGRCPG